MEETVPFSQTPKIPDFTDLKSLEIVAVVRFGSEQYRNFSSRFPACTAIAEVKQMISAKTFIPLAQITLWHRGHPVSDNCTVLDLTGSGDARRVTLTVAIVGHGMQMNFSLMEYLVSVSFGLMPNPKTMRVRGSDTVGSLEERLKREVRCTMMDINLLKRGCILPREQTLASLGVGPSSTLKAFLVSPPMVYGNNPDTGSVVSSAEETVTALRTVLNVLEDPDYKPYNTAPVTEFFDPTRVCGTGSANIDGAPASFSPPSASTPLTIETVGRNSVAPSVPSSTGASSGCPSDFGAITPAPSIEEEGSSATSSISVEIPKQADERMAGGGKMACHSHRSATCATPPYSLCH